MSRTANPETESRLAVARAGGRCMGVTADGDGRSFGVVTVFWSRLRRCLYNIVGVLTATELYTSKRLIYVIYEFAFDKHCILDAIACCYHVGCASYSRETLRA